jgi:hypothetical protein
MSSERNERPDGPALVVIWGVFPLAFAGVLAALVSGVFDATPRAVVAAIGLGLASAYGAFMGVSGRWRRR